MNLSSILFLTFACCLFKVGFPQRNQNRKASYKDGNKTDYATATTTSSSSIDTEEMTDVDAEEINNDDNEDDSEGGDDSLLASIIDDGVGYDVGYNNGKNTSSGGERNHNVYDNYLTSTDDYGTNNNVRSNSKNRDDDSESEEESAWDGEFNNHRSKKSNAASTIQSIFGFLLAGASILVAVYAVMMGLAEGVARHPMKGIIKRRLRIISSLDSTSSDLNPSSQNVDQPQIDLTNACSYTPPVPV